MPCRDWVAEDIEDRKRQQKFSMLEASMCAIMTLAEQELGGLDFILEKLDWKEAGVNRKEFELWWEEHKAKDAAARAEREKRKQAEELKRKALSKLTAAEAEVLGLLKK